MSPYWCKPELSYVCYLRLWMMSHLFRRFWTNLILGVKRFTSREIWCSNFRYACSYWSSETPGISRGMELFNLVILLYAMESPFDDKLSWARHIQSVSTSFSSKVKILKRISFLSRASLETICYKTVVPSAVLYGLVVWSSCSDHLLDGLGEIQLKAFTLINKLPRDMKDDPVYS